MFQSAVCSVPWEWWTVKNYLSESMEFKNASILGLQGQAIRGHPLCGLVHPLALVRQLESIRTGHTCQLQKGSR